MQITTEAIVIREQNIAEDDRLLLLLTKSMGVISAYARGAKRLKSTTASATELLSYSTFVLFKSKDRYYIDHADVNHIFFPIRQDLEKLALASYMAELCTYLIHEDETTSGEAQRLLLNTLSMLEKSKRSPEFLKALFQLRILAMCGYMPDLVGCHSCGAYDAQGGDQLYFLYQEGALCCGSCGGSGHQNATLLGAGVLTAMRHILYAPLEKLFNFTLAPDSLVDLGKISTHYLKIQLERSFHTLEFYESLALL